VEIVQIPRPALARVEWACAHPIPPEAAALIVSLNVRYGTWGFLLSVRDTSTAFLIMSNAHVNERLALRAVNRILGKLWNIASEDVILQLIGSKCMPILLGLYGLEACF